MTIPNLPPEGDTSWYDWATSLDTEARKVAGKLDTATASATYATQTALTNHESDTTAVHGIADTALLVGSSDVDTIVVLTQAAYDAIATKDARTLYVIEG